MDTSLNLLMKNNGNSVQYNLAPLKKLLFGT